jgi:hypothetical protein
MKAALDTAVHRIDRSHRTTRYQSETAQRIVRTASDGITDLDALTSVAVDEGREPAASPRTRRPLDGARRPVNLGAA